MKATPTTTQATACRGDCIFKAKLNRLPPMKPQITRLFLPTLHHLLKLTMLSSRFILSQLSLISIPFTDSSDSSETVSSLEAPLLTKGACPLSIPTFTSWCLKRFATFIEALKSAFTCLSQYGQ